MSLRRTKKDKQKSQHRFLYSWGPTSNQAGAISSVKRQNVTQEPGSNKINPKRENADSIAQVTDLASVKSDILRSLTLALVIVSFEIVLYFVLR